MVHRDEKKVRLKSSIGNSAFRVEVRTIRETVIQAVKAVMTIPVRPEYPCKIK